MGAPLDEKGLSAVFARLRSIGITDCDDAVPEILSAYLSAVAFPDELEEKLRHQHETVGVTPELRAAKEAYDAALLDKLEVAWKEGAILSRLISALRAPTKAFGVPPVVALSPQFATEAADALSQAHSTLAALRAERDEARQEVARYWTSADMTPWVELAESKGLGHFGKKLKGMFNRAIAAEAEVKRLTEDNEALIRKLDLREAALSFVRRWAVQKEGNGTSAEERLSAIAHHPAIATINSREKAE